MKICLINNLYHPDKRGGAEEMVYLLVNELKKQKHDIFVICSSSEYKKTTQEKIEKTTVYRIGYEKYFPFSKINEQSVLKRFLWRIHQFKNKYSSSMIYQLLDKEKPDLILSHNVLALGYNTIQTINKYATINKKKHITTIHDVQLIYPSGILKSGDNYSKTLLKLYIFFTKKMYSSCKFVVFPSNALLKFYNKYKFFRKSSLHIIANPVELESHNNKKTSSEKLRFLYLGQLEEHKGIMELIKTFRQIDAEKFHLTIAGRGSLSQKIQDMIYIVNNIDFVGEFDKEKRINLLQKNDIVVVPSTCFENSPMTIYEAFLSGTPVLASNIGGIPELIEDNVTGWLFNSGNINNLKSKILEIYENKEGIEELQKNCSTFVKQFDIKNYIKKITNLN